MKLEPLARRSVVSINLLVFKARHTYLVIVINCSSDNIRTNRRQK